MPDSLENHMEINVRTSDINALEKKFALLISNTQEACMLVSPDLKTVSLNNAFQNCSNFFSTAIIKKYQPVLNYSQTKNEKQLAAFYQKIFTGDTIKEDVSIEVDGKPIEMSFNYSPAFDEEGKIAAAFVTCRNNVSVAIISPSKFEYEQRFGSFIERISEALVVFDAGLNYTYINKRAAQLIKLEPQEVIGRCIWDLFPQLIGTATFHAYEDAVSGQVYMKSAHYYSSSDLWLENHFYPSPEGLTVITLDISSQKKVEQKLKLSERNLKIIFENASEGFTLLDKNCIIIAFNENANKNNNLIGGASMEIGINILDYLDNDRLEKFRTHTNQVLRGDTIRYDVDYRTKDGGVMWFGVTLCPVVENKIVEGICVTRTDITIRKKYEEKILTNENRLKQAQSVAHVGSWELDFEKNDLNWSDEAYRIFGLNPKSQNVSIELWMSLVHPEDAPALKIEMDNAKSMLSDTSSFYRIVRGDSSVRHIHSENRFEIDKDGNLLTLSGTFHDITQQVNNEKKLFQSHRLLQKLTEKLPMAVFQFQMTDEGISSLPFMSRAIEDLFPEADIEYLKRDVSLILRSVHPDDVSLLVASFKESRKNFSDWNLEFRSISHSGEVRWLRGFSRQEKKNDATIFYGYLENITDRKFAEEKIKVSKERYDLVARATNDSIYDWDLLTGEVLRTGDGLKHLFGYSIGDAVNEKDFWKNRIHPDDVTASNSVLQECLADKFQNYCKHEYRFLKADGTYAYVYDKGFIIRNEDGKAVRMIGATQDVTSLQTVKARLEDLNEDFRKRAEELAVSNKELEQFAYVVSHDLQEPLGMITSFLALLENKYATELDEKARQYIHYASDGAIRMRRIIFDLLEYSRVGRKNVVFELIDSNDLVEEALYLNKSEVDDTKAIFRLKNLPMIKGNRSSLQQVFQNLIANAIKYRKPGQQPIIEISAQEDDLGWQFAISDNGIGIDEKYFERIFVVFQRLHNSSTYSGTGIGLSICKKVVENHGGKIWLESVPDAGTTFYFKIAK